MFNFFNKKVDIDTSPPAFTKPPKFNSGDIVTLKLNPKDKYIVSHIIQDKTNYNEIYYRISLCKGINEHGHIKFLEDIEIDKDGNKEFIQGYFVEDLFEKYIERQNA